MKINRIFLRGNRISADWAKKYGELKRFAGKNPCFSKQGFYLE